MLFETRSALLVSAFATSTWTMVLVYAIFLRKRLFRGLRKVPPGARIVEKIGLIFCIIATLATAPLVAYALTRWRVHVDAEGGYSAAFPGEPLDATTRKETPEGTIVTHSLHFDGRASAPAVWVSWVRLAPAMREMKPEAIFEMKRGDLVPKNGVIVEQESALSVDGRPAHEIVFREDAPATSHDHVRLILDGERIFLLTVMTSDGRFAKEQAAAARYFLESFHFTSPAAPTGTAQAR